MNPLHKREPTPPTMSERFDEKYKSVFDAYPDFKESHWILLTNIKSFIENELKLQKEEIKAEVRKMIRIPIGNGVECLEDRNILILAVLKLLE
jgi:hypothetical protein